MNESITGAGEHSISIELLLILVIRLMAKNFYIQLNSGEKNNWFSQIIICALLPTCFAELPCEQSRTLLSWCLHEGWCTQVLEGGSLYLRWEALLSKLVLIFLPINYQWLDSRKAALYQPLAIPPSVVACIIHCLLMFRVRRAGQALFLITRTEVMSLLSVMLTKSTEI